MTCIHFDWWTSSPVTVELSMPWSAGIPPPDSGASGLDGQDSAG